MPVHRDKTVVCIRGHFEEYLYDSEGHLIETIDIASGGIIVNVQTG